MGTRVNLLITKILQDEPINGQGDGNFIPDAVGIEAPKAWLRSERAGGGDGRVYHVYFTADDGFGGTCEGEVKVGVPKSQGSKGGPVDGGPIYNSTLESLSFSPRFLRFLYQEVGTTSIRQTVTMTNITPNALDLIAFDSSGPFAIADNGCGPLFRREIAVRLRLLLPLRLKASSKVRFASPAVRQTAPISCGFGGWGDICCFRKVREFSGMETGSSIRIKTYAGMEYLSISIWGNLEGINGIFLLWATGTEMAKRKLESIGMAPGI